MKNKSFTYIKENNTFICENNTFKIEFSKPIVKSSKEGNSINPNVKIQQIDAGDEIESCTYSMKISQSINGNKWRTINQIDINGFGIFYLKNLIHEMLNKKKSNCQKSIEYWTDCYSYIKNTEECYSNDFYEIRKIWDSYGNISFELYIGISSDSNFNYSSGIKLKNLSYEDLLVWRKCIYDFIHYAITIENQRTRTVNKSCCKQYKIEEGKIFYDDNLKQDVFIESEEVSVKEIIFSNKDTFSVKLHKDVTIEKITSKYILLSDKTKIRAGKIVEIKREQ